MATYYDFILGLIPLVLIGVSGGLHLGGLTTPLAVSAGGLLAIALVGHALFVRSPVHRTGTGATNQFDA